MYNDIYIFKLFYFGHKRFKIIVVSYTKTGSLTYILCKQTFQNLFFFDKISHLFGNKHGKNPKNQILFNQIRKIPLTKDYKVPGPHWNFKLYSIGFFYYSNRGSFVIPFN